MRPPKPTKTKQRVNQRVCATEGCLTKLNKFDHYDTYRCTSYLTPSHFMMPQAVNPCSSCTSLNPSSYRKRMDKRHLASLPLPPLVARSPSTKMTLSQLLLWRHLTCLKVGRGPGPGMSLTPGTHVPPLYLVRGPLATLRGHSQEKGSKTAHKKMRAWTLPCLLRTGLILTPSALVHQTGRIQDLGTTPKMGSTWEATPLALPRLRWTVSVALR